MWCDSCDLGTNFGFITYLPTAYCGAFSQELIICIRTRPIATSICSSKGSVIYNRTKLCEYNLLEVYILF